MLVNGREFLEAWNSQLERAQRLVQGAEVDDNLIGVEDIKIQNLEDLIEEKTKEAAELLEIEEAKEPEYNLKRRKDKIE